jgi:CBS domain containing-hemolysin-like protein
LGHLPQEGEQVDYDSFKLIVAEVKGNRITKLMITKEEEPQQKEPEKPESM